MALSGEHMSDSEPIVIDAETWGAQELYEVIASRYFVLGNEGAIPASWEVRGLDGKNTSDQLVRLNRHLEPLGMVGILEDKDPPTLSIAHYPSSHSVLRTWQQAIVWFLMAGFMTMVGASWLARYDSGSSVLQAGAFSQSALFFTLPIVASLLVASQFRSIVAKRYGVEIGHIVPIVFPIPTPSWPFGIIGVMGQRRADLVPMPNRKALGLIEIVIPLTLFVAGTALTIVGLSMTSSAPPNLEEAPVVFEANAIVQILSASWLGEDFSIRLQWLHPTGIAGIGLAIVGWGLMLPIPGFPGDRALHSLIGPSEMRDGSIQTSIFVVMLAVLVLVFATSDYMPWIFLAAVGAWQRFSPESVPQPFVVDEYAELDDRIRGRIASMVLIVLIAGFPGMMPSSLIEDYDAGLSTERWPDELEVRPGVEMSFSLVLEPEGVLPVSGWLQMRIEGAMPGKWGISSECLDSIGACSFSDVIQANRDEVSIAITPPEAGVVPHSLRILVDVQGNQKEHLIRLIHVGSSAPLQPLWALVEDSATPLICMDVIVSEGDAGNLTAINPYWVFENETDLLSGQQEICMRGHEGAIQSSENMDEQHRKFGPEIVFERYNGSNESWRLAIEGSEPAMHVFGGEWSLPGWFAGDSEFVINHADGGSAFCPSIEMAAEVDSSENWTRALEDHTPIRIIGDRGGNGTLGLGDVGWMAVCTGDGLVESYRIVEGVDVLISPGSIDRGLRASEFALHNRGDEPLPVSVEWHGDSPESDIWDISIPDLIEPAASAVVEASPTGDPSLIRALWVSADETGVVVHLAARCPTGGCS
ncbi:MAG: hypothetical protein CMA54_01720 [Euryarchaeota archaeon]|nr:hypothetical protein [Euryarchaeota archaeon]MBV43488.1 hypothetical protein [Euryarchaeota archaeon]HJO84107.1 hypothetical protein [Candidatus Thalassarchaeaceae archaeon]